MRTVIVLEQAKTAYYLNSIAEQTNSYILSVFPTLNAAFEQENTPYHNAIILLNRIHKLIIGLQLRSWQSNTTNLNPI